MIMSRKPAAKTLPTPKKKQMCCKKYIYFFEGKKTILPKNLFSVSIIFVAQKVSGVLSKTWIFSLVLTASGDRLRGHT